MLMLSVFVQNIVDMIVDYALWVAVLKKEFSKIIEGRVRVPCYNLPSMIFENSFFRTATHKA